MGDAVELLTPELHASKVSVELDPTEIVRGQFDWHGYPGDMSQVVTNLLQNACLHGYPPTFHKRPRIVHISLHDLGSTYKITLRDDGVGMDYEHATRVWDPFFTTRRAKGSTGLGLTIVRNLVSGRLNGSVSCRSELNRGTAFVIEIPKVVVPPIGEPLPWPMFSP